ncbi:hypothetical protein EJ04DRAFT_453273, partial [Polyplosphaeria fusca]
RAAEAYNVRHQQISDQMNRQLYQPEAQPNCHKLISTDVRLEAARGGQPIEKNWAERYVARTQELKMAFN